MQDEWGDCPAGEWEGYSACPSAPLASSGHLPDGPASQSGWSARCHCQGHRVTCMQGGESRRRARLGSGGLGPTKPRSAPSAVFPQVTGGSHVFTQVSGALQ